MTETARVWRRRYMGDHPTLSIHVYSETAREVPVEVPGVSVFHGVEEVPSPLVMGPVRRGFAGEEAPIYGVSPLDVRRVVLHASRGSFDTAIRRPTPSGRLAEALRQMDNKESL